MKFLIRDLQDVAHIETGTLPVTLRPTEVVVIVDEARNRFHSGGGRNNLHIDLAPNLPLVMADQQRMVQVLGNLLSNAARYSPESSAIRVCACADEFHVSISVTDEGSGVTAERLSLLFRKFSRLYDQDMDSTQEGSGLGLAICKGIVESHGGRIWSESDGPGMGTRVTLTVPVSNGPGLPGITESPRRSLRPQNVHKERPRILAVDDDPHILRYIRSTLSKEGFDPIVTGDPREALHHIEVNSPHLVLLDLMLPGTDGIQLMTRMLEIADVPVIFLSAYSQEEVVVRAFELGAVDYVVKPFSPSELAARIRGALRRSHTTKYVDPSVPFVQGHLTIDYGERRVRLAGQQVPLTSLEYRMLAAL